MADDLILTLGMLDIISLLSSAPASEQRLGTGRSSWCSLWYVVPGHQPRTSGPG